ncbi:hypothetical protein IX39_12015 [Chryseobacterium formosense]|uniref:M23ase beta-sheet core domain-containing protein n=1 Tax=Chryseobacterium formosense TaxID=236814 RepID=A0A085ZA37_9FLAO|nr:M23 family metallopeptidase [Chryseobacterium formosense]KFF01301.1 hypothetical protein IX39_12015 [Chryseobacterium formosense]SFT45342.1 Murein DD-endopeptidase MepM and murein hydrolase activator NlpD, contain LysM domain [Chryseobacterium formosense]
METKVKYIITVLILGSYSLFFAQFNTLTPKKITSNEVFNEQKSFQDESAFKKEKKTLLIINKLFNAPNKNDLKKEIDSLKSLILRYDLSKTAEIKANSKISIDSIFQNNTKKISTEDDKSKRKPVKDFDFISEEKYTSRISMPLNNRLMVTSPFGRRVHPIFGATRMHNGTDLKANYENVYAVLDGTVIASGWDSAGGGNYLKIRHSDSFVTSYLHLSEIYYKEGEFVKVGYIVAKSGNSGNSTGPHLHFSVTENGKFINPIRFLNDLIKTNNLIANYYETGRSLYRHY